MQILYFLVPVALLLAFTSLLGFFWAARSGQFDDVETPALRILLDEEAESPPQRKGCIAPSDQSPDPHRSSSKNDKES